MFSSGEHVGMNCAADQLYSTLSEETYASAHIFKVGCHGLNTPSYYPLNPLPHISPIHPLISISPQFTLSYPSLNSLTHIKSIQPQSLISYPHIISQFTHTYQINSTSHIPQFTLSYPLNPFPHIPLNPLPHIIPSFHSLIFP